MSLNSKNKQLGFLTRLLDSAPAVERYQIALDQIIHAEKLGYDNAWIAQHHFDPHEGVTFSFCVAFRRRTGDPKNYPRYCSHYAFV